MAAPAQGEKLRSGLVAGGGLVIPHTFAIKHLVGANHQGIAMASGYPDRLGGRQTLANQGGLGAVRGHGALDLVFVHGRDLYGEFHAGAFKKRRAHG